MLKTLIQLTFKILKTLKSFFLTKDEHKDKHKTIFQHRYLHALAKLSTAEPYRWAIHKCKTLKVGITASLLDVQH